MKDKSINRRIAQYRKLAQFSQEELAELMDMKPSTYSQMERRGNIDCVRLLRIAKILKADILELLFGEEKAKELRKYYAKLAILSGEVLPIGGEPLPKPEPKPEPPDINLTVRDKNHISVIHNLSAEDKTRVYEFAYELFKTKRQRRQKNKSQFCTQTKDFLQGQASPTVRY